MGWSPSILPGLSSPPSLLSSSAIEGARPHHGPVNTYTGALSYGMADMTVEDAGKSITATRSYRSDRTTSTDLSSGWLTSYSEAVLANGTVTTLTLADGRSMDFGIDAAAGYVPQPGVDADFSQGTLGTTITTPGRTTYDFDTGGELTGITLGDPGHKLTVTRSGGKVDKVTGISGRYVSYSRSGGKLQSIQDSTSRDVVFGYTSGRLTSAQGVDNKTEPTGTTRRAGSIRSPPRWG